MYIQGADTETGLILPGNLCPPLVCLSRARVRDGQAERQLLDRRAGVEWFRAALGNQDLCTVWMNGPFDWAVLVEEAEEIFGPEYAEELLELVFQALRDGRLSDVETREKLLLNADGLLIDVDEESARGIPLHVLTQKYLGVDIKEDKKNPNAWRLRYGELRDVPLDAWPAEAVRYAEDDSLYNVLVYLKQQAAASESGYADPEHPHLITDERRQVAKKWALHLMAAWGCRTDAERVPVLAAEVKRQVAEVEQLVLWEGLARTKVTKGIVEVSQNRRSVQDRVAVAYACQALDLDVAEFRARCESDAPPEASETALAEWTGASLCDTTLRCLHALVHEYGVKVRGFPAVYPKGEKPFGGGLCVVVNGVETTPSTLDPLKVSERFPRGQASWSREVLKYSKDPALVAYAEQNDILKIDSTYVPILVHGLRFPINPRYDEMKRTGRTSCKRPNMQNLPTFGGIRECFVAREGWVLVDADIDQAECVAWAQWCLEEFGVSEMGRAINDGRDPHLWLAIHFPALAGVSYEDAAARLKAGDKVVKKYRQMSKIGNFGRMGGMGAETLLEYARGYGAMLTLDEAQEIIDAFDAAWPESQHAQRWVGSRVRGDRLFTFEQPISGRRRGGCGYTDGRNQPFQGRIADLGGDVLFCLAEECYGQKESPLYGARPWAFVHDEFILEVPYLAWGRDRTHAAARRLEQVIEERGRFWCPDVAIRSSAAMARRWVKDRRAGTEFKRVLDAQGRLIPMEDEAA